MRKVRRCVVNPCLAAEEMEAWSRLMACLSFENNLSIEPLRPRFVDCGLEHHYFCLYFECVSYFCFLSCRLMQPVSSYCPWWLDRRRNLRQDGLCLTVRSCTAKFHQDRHVPGASAAFQWRLITASPGLHVARRCLAGKDISLCLEWKVTLICPPLVSKGIWRFLPFWKPAIKFNLILTSCFSCSPCEIWSIS